MFLIKYLLKGFLQSPKRNLNPKKDFQKSTVRRFPAKEGFRPDLKMNFRSKMEANMYRYLTEWHPKLCLLEYEPHLFTSNDGLPIGFSYLPDFRATTHEGDQFYIEIKGVLDDKTKYVFSTMRKYRPDVKIVLVGPRTYKSIERRFSKKTPGWEF